MSYVLQLLNGGAGNLAAYLAAHVLLCLSPAADPLLECAAVTREERKESIMSKDFAQIADEENTALRACHRFDGHAKP